MDRKAVSPVIAIVLLLMMTVAAAGAAYFWLTSMQSRMQKRSTKSIENIMQKSGRRLIAQAAICEPTYSYEGLVGYWKMNEGEGDYANDSSGYDNDGTLANGPDWVDGYLGHALDFNGTQYVDCGNPPELSGLNELSFSMWVRPKEGGTTLSKASYGSSGEWLFGTNTTGYSFRVINGTGYNVIVKSSATFEPNSWHYVVGTYSRSDSSLKIYVDGKLEGEKTTDLKIEEASQNVRIGGQSGGAVRGVNGTIDEVHVYNRTLDLEEINEISQGKMKVDFTVRNVGSVSIPEAEFVANLKKDGTTVDSDTYVTESSIDTGDLKTLTFYFNEMRPGGEGYTISIPGIDVSQTVNCQSLED